MITKYEKYMQMAIMEAKKAGEKGDVPIGAVIVKNGEIIAAAHNLRENGGGATAHAELLAINEACRHEKSWRLSGCELYVTLEPCPMCAGAIINARIDRVVFGAKDPRAGALGSLIDLNTYPLGHKAEVVSGVCRDECLSLIKDFFKSARDREPYQNKE